jgi:hypothetical protein
LGERPWYAGVFDDHYLRIFASALVDERTAAEVNGATSPASRWSWTRASW